MSILNFPSEVKEEITVSIPKNIVEVFDFVAVHFLQNYRKWSPEVDLIECLSAGGFAVNSQFRQVRSDKGDLSEVMLTVTQLDPPRRFAYANFKDHYQCHYVFEEGHATSTHLTFCFHLEEIDLAMRPFVKLLRTAVQEGVRQTAHNIKQLLDHESAQLLGGQK